MFFLNFKSDRIYDSLLNKVEELNRIVCRYPFISEVKFDNPGFVEISMLILYAMFPVAHMNDYSSEDMKRIVENGLHELSLHSTTYPPEVSNQEFLLLYEEVVDMIYQAAQTAANVNEDVFWCVAACYIVYIFKWKAIEQKISEASFYDEYLSMHSEIRNFWKDFCQGKWTLA